MAGISFDATTVAPQAPNDLIPAGTYLAMATDSDVRPTKAGTGQVAKFTFQIIDGQFTGRKVFANINIQNPNATAQQIGQAQLSALCHAVGVLRPGDTVELHGKPVKIKVKIRKDATGQYQDQNEVVGYEAASGAPAPAGVPSAAGAVPSAAAAPAGAVPPWKRSAA